MQTHFGAIYIAVVKMGSSHSNDKFSAEMTDFPYVGQVLLIMFLTFCIMVHQSLTNQDLFRVVLIVVAGSVFEILLYFALKETSRLRRVQKVSLEADRQTIIDARAAFLAAGWKGLK